MKKFFTLLLLGQALLAHAQPNHLVISQVYTAGGNEGASYTHDFVELYNPTSSPVSLSGWSVQYAGATSTTWSNSNKANLSGSIGAGKYFLVQLDGGPVGKPLPQPDITVTNVNVNLSTTGGKVALVNSTSLLSGACPAGGSIVDLVSYKGTGTPNCSETAPMVTPTNNLNSITRKNNGCTDTDNNSTDFENTTPSPRNSSSNGHTCNSGSISVSTVLPNPFCVDAANGAAGTVSFTTSGTFSNSTLRAVMSDAAGSFGYTTTVGSAIISGTNPSGTINVVIPANTASGTGYKIRIESTDPLLTSSNQSNAFEIINGAKNLLPNEFSSAANNTTLTLNWTNPTGCFDEILIVAKEGNSISGTPSGDGSAYTADSNFLGNGTPFDGGKVVYKGSGNRKTIINLANGTTYFFKAYTRRGTTWSSGTEISDKPRVVPLPGEIVINQLSPGYSGSTDEYIELVNLTGKPFDLADVAIRITNGSGNTVVAGGTLSGTIPPHGFWLVSPKATITVGQTTALPRDGSIDEGFGATNNQIGLIRKTDNTILDAVGYGTITTRTYTEGTAAVNPPSGGGLKRIVSGADSDNNRADFATVTNSAIELRNSSSRLANAGAAIPAGNYSVLEVTGNASLSGAAVFSEKVVLIKGIFSLNDYTLSTATVSNAAETRYIRTSGSGSLTLTNVTGEKLFPIGNSTYNPVTVSNGSGLSWSVNVTDAVVPNPTPFNKEAAVQRTWNVTPSATPPSGATLVFEYNDNDPTQLGSAFDKTKDVQVWNYHAGNWQSVTGPQTPVAVPPGRKAVSLSNYRQFSPFVIANVNAPLPVHFVNFSARVQADGVHLQFTNIGEKEVARYEIERSVNGQDFKTLIQLEPRNNNGSKTTYHWLDAAPPVGDVWYRIKGVDLDGTLSYTPALRLSKRGDTKTLVVYPNPVQGRTLAWQAALPQGSYILTVSNSSGQHVLQQTFEYSGGNRTETLYLPLGLQPGVYRLQISSGSFIRQQTFVLL